MARLFEKQSKEINGLPVESTGAGMDNGFTTWEEVAQEVGLRLRRSAAEDALGESVEFAWSEHDPDCSVFAGATCDCRAVYWFRGQRHVVAVDANHISEVLTLH